MTLEEFREKLKNEIHFFGTDDDFDSVCCTFTLRAEDYPQLVDKHRKDGDLMDFYFKEIESTPCTNIKYVIMAFLSAEEIATLKNDNVKNSYYIRRINEHIEKDDLESWILEIENEDIYYFLIKKNIVQEYLINKHNKDGDLEKWFLSLEKNKKDFLGQNLFTFISKQEKL